MLTDSTIKIFKIHKCYQYSVHFVMKIVFVYFFFFLLNFHISIFEKMSENSIKTRMKSDVSRVKYFDDMFAFKFNWYCFCFHYWFEENFVWNRNTELSKCSFALLYNRITTEIHSNASILNAFNFSRFCFISLNICITTLSTRRE